MQQPLSAVVIWLLCKAAGGALRRVSRQKKDLKVPCASPCRCSTRTTFMIAHIRYRAAFYSK